MFNSTVPLLPIIDDIYIKPPLGVDQNLTIFIGVVTIYEKIEIRECMREVYRHNNAALARYLGVENSPVTIRFILGLPKDKYKKDKMEQESKLYGDIVILNVTENMDEGKTFEYFKWFAKHRNDDYLAKTDDDTFIHLIHYYRDLQDLPRKRAYYGGVYYAQGPHDNGKFDHMGGAGYTVSRDLVMEIVDSNWVSSNIKGYEDLQTANWICHVANEKKYPVHFTGFVTTWKPMRQFPFHNYDEYLDAYILGETILIHQLWTTERWNAIKDSHTKYKEGLPIMKVIRNSTVEGLVTKREIALECMNQTLQNTYTYKNWFYEAWGFKEGKWYGYYEPVDNIGITG